MSEAAADIRRLVASDLEAAWQLDREAFHVPEERRALYLETADPNEYMGAFEGDELVAQSAALAMGQYFGGRAVQMGGLSSVATAPHARGRGYGKAVVRACLERMRERGDAISSLHPATTALYRRLGWEVAGACAIRKASPRAFSALPEARGVRVRRLPAGDVEAARRCYSGLAAQVNGFVERGARTWQGLARRWRESFGFVAEDGDGAPVGYLVYRQFPGEYGALGGPFGILVEDHAATTPDAARALWRMLGSWSTQVEQVLYRGSPEDPLLLVLPQQELRTLAEIRWMTRMVDVTRAVAARGFPPGLEVEVPLALGDALLGDNDGRFVLQVTDGKGRLQPGGHGSVSMDVGAFASLYTGWASTGVLARSGRLEGGSPDERARLDAAFAGPTPWMLEEF